MTYRTPTPDIIKSVIDAMSFTVRIRSVVRSGTTHTLTVCDVYHAQVGFTVTIGGKNYTITSVTYPGTLVVTGTSANITATSFEMYRPFFFHGTPKAVGKELSDITDAGTKTPTIWLMENYKDVDHEDADDPFDREINGRLFFLSQEIKENQMTAEAYDNVIVPMCRLRDLFVAQLKKMKGSFYMDDFKVDTQNWAEFVIYPTQKGPTARVFTDKLAGTELNLSPLWVYRAGACPVGCATS